MKYYKNTPFVGLALVVLLLVGMSTGSFAGEKIGNLVFNAMKEIQDSHETFLQDVQELRTQRGEATAEREAVKKKYENARAGTLDRREFHARFSFAQAKVYRLLYEESGLTHEIARKQLGILNRLSESITSGEVGLTSNEANSVIEASKPFLENGKSLLVSLGQYRDKITDPVINSRLNGVVETAEVLSRYIDHIEKGRVNKYASQIVLKQKVAELIDQLSALYVQTDVLMAMIRDKTTVLKMINELAASEMMTLALLDGGQVINHLSSDVMSPLMDVFYESDEDLDILTDGVLNNGGGHVLETSSYSQKWASPTF